MQIVDLAGKSPAGWRLGAVALTEADGTALPALAQAGLAAPTDPEPEYVSINGHNQLAVTLQENNGVALDRPAPPARITKVFSAGTVTVSGIDTKKDGVIDLTGSHHRRPREPDAIAWVDDTLPRHRQRGRLEGRHPRLDRLRQPRRARRLGRRQHLRAARRPHGLHNDDRAGKKGAEPEGLAVAEFDGIRYAFVGSERSNFVAVYDLDDAALAGFQAGAADHQRARGHPAHPVARPARGLQSRPTTPRSTFGPSVSLFQLGTATPHSRASSPARTGPARPSAGERSAR